MKLGFSILEFMTVMTISVIIVGGLFEVYRVVRKNMVRVERFTFEETQIIAMKNRLEQDITGVAAIWFTQQAAETKDLLAGKKMDAPENLKRNQFFYATEKDGKVEKITFMTTASVMTTFGQESQRFVRVMYALQQDKEHKGLYALMRKELPIVSEDIDEKSLERGRWYQLVGGISSLQAAYHFIDTQVIKAQAKGEAKDKKAIRSVRQWGVEDVDEQEATGGVKIPKFIRMKVVFGKTPTQQKQEYQLDFMIPVSADIVPKNYVHTYKEKKQNSLQTGSAKASLSGGK